jgi:hypothetical protein
MNREDRFYYIHGELTKWELWSKFNAQLEKMKWQEKHRFKDVLEQWEYAYNKITKEE